MPIELTTRKAPASDPLSCRDPVGPLGTSPHLVEVTSHSYGKLEPESGGKEGIAVKISGMYDVIVCHCPATRRTHVSALTVGKPPKSYYQQLLWVLDGQKTSMEVLVIAPRDQYSTMALEDVFRQVGEHLDIPVSFTAQVGAIDTKTHPSVVIVERGTAKTAIVDLGKGRNFNSDGTVTTRAEQAIRSRWTMLVGLNQVVQEAYDQVPAELFEQYDGKNIPSRLPILGDSARALLINARLGTSVQDFVDKIKPGRVDMMGMMRLNMLVGMLLRMPAFCKVCGQEERDGTKILRCSGCKAEEYCGAAHQKEDRPYHKRI